MRRRFLGFAIERLALLAGNRSGHSLGRLERRRGRLRLEPLERRALLSAVTVTSGADSGAGSFRAAVEAANNDPSISAIVFDEALSSVELESTVVYEGSQALTIDGNDVTIGAADDAEGDFDLFHATGGADLTLEELTFEDGANGVVVIVPADAKGNVEVTLSEVVIQDNDLFGLHINDLAGSNAGVTLTLSDSDILANGTAAHDRDGIRVDERGAGDIGATIVNSHLDGNGAEGIELDEGGSGNVRLTASGSTFNDNGFVSSGDPDEPDFDDGIDIDEADAGNVFADISDSEVSGNFDEGIDLNEEGPGSLFANLTNVTANENSDEGIALEEEDEGNVLAIFRGLVVNDNGNDGIQVEESDNGNLFLQVSDSVISRNDGYGVNVEQNDSGSGWLRLKNVTFDKNLKSKGSKQYDADGVKVTEEDTTHIAP